MKIKHQKPMQQFYMDYIGPAFTIDESRVVELGRGLDCQLRFELDAKYNLLVIVDNVLITTFSMDVTGNHIGVMQLQRPIDIHEEYVLAVMLIVKMMIDCDIVLTEKEATLLDIFKQVMIGIKEYING